MRTCLNIGCGGETRFPETDELHWVNIDARTDVGADMVLDARNLTPFPDNSVYKIVSIHMLEHLPRHDAPKALAEWYRVLSPGGELRLEVPNFDLTIKEYLAGDEAMQNKRVENVYGRQFFPGDAHSWGYNYRRLSRLLITLGYTNIEELKEYSYHIKEEPCLAVSARKPMPLIPCTHC